MLLDYNLFKLALIVCGVAMILPPYAYLLSRLVSAAYFDCKAAFLRKLVDRGEG